MSQVTSAGKGRLIRSHKDLQVYQTAVESAMSIFEATRKFPREEACSLTSQIRRSSRSVAANIAEAWRKRRYEAAFIAKLSDSDAEAAEAQVHLEFAVKCGYLSRAEGERLYREYESLLRILVAMINGSATWLLPSAKRKP